jgi:curved DNA-binding protein CbpA
MDATRDHYAVLGVLPNAEDVIIRAAYRALAQRYHPDRFVGPRERMAEINEAYAILSNPTQRARYDSLRGSGALSGSSYFHEVNDSPPSPDPLQRDWAIALTYYPDLADLEAQLAKISWRLAYTFKAVLLDQKTFENRFSLSESIEQQFLKQYFGNNTEIIRFARDLIGNGNKPAALALNEAIRVLGSSIDANRVVQQIGARFNIDHEGMPRRGSVDSEVSFLNGAIAMWMGAISLILLLVLTLAASGR